MHLARPLSGIYAAAVTPLRSDQSLDLDSLPALLEFLAGRGCHGILLFGTTGEGPSFSPRERLAAFKVAAEFRRARPAVNLLAGTGTPSLDETIELTRQAFELGMDGVVVLPPYYFRKAPEDGLLGWYSEVIRRAVPTDGWLLAYHIPPVSGMPLSIELVSRLKDAHPHQFAGLKDSSADPEHARLLGESFGPDLAVFNGTDRIFSRALEAGASGAITALANLCSPWLRQVWDARRAGEAALQAQAQARLDAARTVLDKYPPAPPLIKMALSHYHGLPAWTVRLPLLPLSPAQAEPVIEDLDQVL